MMSPCCSNNQRIGIRSIGQIDGMAGDVSVDGDCQFASAGRQRCGFSQHDAVGTDFRQFKILPIRMQNEANIGRIWLVAECIDHFYTAEQLAETHNIRHRHAKDNRHWAEWQYDARIRSEQYVSNRRKELSDCLGQGYDGVVFSTNAGAAVKSLAFEKLYQK